MASQVMRITLKAYDHKLIDQSAGKIIETVKKTGSKVSGPVRCRLRKRLLQFLEQYTSTKIQESSSSREHTRD